MCNSTSFVLLNFILNIYKCFFFYHANLKLLGAPWCCGGPDQLLNSHSALGRLRVYFTIEGSSPLVLLARKVNPRPDLLKFLEMLFMCLSAVSVSHLAHVVRKDSVIANCGVLALQSFSALMPLHTPEASLFLYSSSGFQLPPSSGLLRYPLIHRLSVG